VTPYEYLEQLQHSHGMERVSPLTRERFEDTMPAGYRDSLLKRTGGDADAADTLHRSIVKQMEQAEAERPTIYEEAWSYSLMKGLASQLEVAGNSVLEKRRPIPAFGTLRLGQLNAMAIKVPDCNEPVIAFQQGVFGFANLLSKAVAASLPSSSEGSNLRFSFDLKEAEARWTQDPTPVRRLDEFLFAYTVNGHPHTAEQYFLHPPASLLAEQLLGGFELFIFGHELGHVYAGHLDLLLSQAFNLEAETIQRLPASWQQEFEADYLGLRLTMQAMMERGMDVALSFCGPDLVFSAIELVDRALSTLRHGEVREAPESSTHPPPDTRRQMLRSHLDELGTQDSQSATDLASSLQAILERMWLRLEPAFLIRHEKGLRPAPSWQGG
jgi:hypothetical protein